MTQERRRKRKTPSSGSPKQKGVDNAPKVRDTMLVHGVSDDGENLAVLRARNDRLEAGVVRRVKEGEPIMGELLRLRPRPESPLLCDVEVELAARPVTDTIATASAQDKPTAKLNHGGPAQVATPSYRQNWDAIWSQSKKRSAPN